MALPPVPSIKPIALIVYFARKNNSLLALTRTKFYPKALLKACMMARVLFLNRFFSSA